MSEMDGPRLIEFPGVDAPPIPRRLMSADTSPERLEVEQRLGVTHEEMLREVMDWFEKAKKAKRNQELTWYLCLSFYLGDQYASVDHRAQRILSGFEDKRVPKHRVRIVDNKIAPAADNLVSQLVRGFPTLAASPATEEAEDIDGALLATAVLEHEHRRINQTALDHDLRLWKVITGTSGLWTRWNETHGPIGEDKRPIGEIEFVVCSPFALYPDPACKSMSGARFFIHASEEDVDTLKEAYPDVADKIQSDESTKGQARDYEREIQTRMGGTLSYGSETSRDQNLTTVINCWVPRCRKYPDGLHLICVPSVMLWMDANPWAHFGGPAGWCPINIYRHRSLTASFWGKGAVEDAISLQKDLNKTLSQIIEHRNLMTRGRYWYPTGMKFNADKLTGEPGEMVPVTPPRPELLQAGVPWFPQREDPPPFPQGHIRMLQILNDSIEDVFSYHQVMKGNTPPGVRSAVAIEALAEKDEINQFPIAVRDNVEWALVGRRLLALAHDMWETERYLRIRGEDGEYGVASFRGMDIPQFVDVVVEADTMLPTSKAGRTQALIEMTNAGIIPPEMAQEAVLGGYGTIRAWQTRASLDKRKQRREIWKLIRGIACQPDNFDEHMIHLKEINDYRKTAAFERIRLQPVMVTTPDGRPLGMSTVEQVVEQHALGHAIMGAKQAAALAAQSQPLATGPNAGPGGAPGEGKSPDASAPTAPRGKPDQNGVTNA